MIRNLSQECGNKGVIAFQLVVISFKERKTIARLNPLGNPRSDRIKVLFTVDEQRFLKITVEDILTNETLLQSATVA